MAEPVITRVLDACPVCESRAGVPVLELPLLPLTGIYVDDWRERYPTPDNCLMICEDCGHGYLRNVVSPDLLYRKTYTHETSGSAISRDGNEFFAQFVHSLGGARDYVFEIGCNDGYLSGDIYSKRYSGVDPNGRAAWIINKYVGDVTASDIDGHPDLIVSAHTLEHLATPYEDLRTIIDCAADGALIVVEVPSLERMVRLGRFDQVFHQHIQYFTRHSMARLFGRLGCGCVGEAVNHAYWNGTQLMAFRKGAGEKDCGPISITPLAVHLAMRRFVNNTDVLCASVPGRFYGYGAAQMIPVLLYHCSEIADRLDGIIDDNPARQGKYFPGLGIPIISPESVEISEATIMVTALDSMRPIMRKLLDLLPRQIIRPLADF